MRLFHPILSGAHAADRLFDCFGAGLGIAFAAVIAAWSGLLPGDLPLLVAPLGASAVLVFAVPASPLAQPWPVIGGNTISAVVGVAVFHLVPGVAAAGSVAVAAAILIMSLMRCLHPPGGASALTAVIGSSAIHAAGFSFALLPVALNSVSLVLVGLLFHRFSRHSYPHRSAAVADGGLLLADIDAALEDMHEDFDISREDLGALLSRAELHAAERKGR